MIESKHSPFQHGYRRGYLAARNFVFSVRARIASGQDIAPNELGCILERLHRRMDASGGRSSAECPMSPRSPNDQSLRGEYFGFCTGLSDILKWRQFAHADARQSAPGEIGSTLAASDQ